MSRLLLQFLGQSGIRLQHGDDVLLVDPYLSDAVAESAAEPSLWRRRFPAPFAPEAVTDALAIACTHEHADHIDPATVARLLRGSPRAAVLVPEWARSLVAELVPAGQLRTCRGERDEHRFGSFRLIAVPAAHSERYAVEHDEARGHRWQGFVIEAGGVRLYHAGDTVAFDGQLDTLRELGPIDVALLPINGRDAVRERHGVIGNLWPREAAELAVELGAEVLIPLHHDLFPFNGIAPGMLADYALEHALPLEIRLLVAGGRTLIPTSQARTTSA